MPKELLLKVALRVLRCFSPQVRAQPKAADVERLRQSCSGEEKGWEAKRLASHVISRRLRERSAKDVTK